MNSLLTELFLCSSLSLALFTTLTNETEHAGQRQFATNEKSDKNRFCLDLTSPRQLPPDIFRCILEKHQLEEGNHLNSICIPDEV